MIHLLSLAKRRTFELGPIPTELPDDVRAVVIDHLHQAGLTDSNGATLTELGQSLIEPLGATDEHYWGILTLHNMRQPVVFDVDDHWMYMLQESLRTAAISGPKVYFLIARSDKVLTTAIRNGNEFSLSTQPLTGGRSFTERTAEFIMTLADPTGRTWPVAPITSFAVPYSALGDAPARGFNADAPAEQKNAYRRLVSSWTSGLADRLPAPALSTLTRLLTADHSAAASVLYTRGPERHTSDHSATLDFFHELGIVATHPRQTGDGALWKHIAPGTSAAFETALQSLVTGPSTPQKVFDTASTAARSAKERQAQEARQYVDIGLLASHIDPSRLAFLTVDPASEAHQQLVEHFKLTVVPAWVASGELAVSDWDLAAACPVLPASISVEQLAAALRAEPERLAAAEQLRATRSIATVEELIVADIVGSYQMTIVMAFTSLQGSH
ncbi:ESX secretion-associated protein EspG [Gordonia malaquae]|uniref:ESX secretion-associated protein EspG n=1 Tax=Gordonia malaquae TaxID=410332 RepID=UPI0030175316